MPLLSLLRSRFRESPFGGKFARDVLWNVASLFVLGVTGIVLTTGIGRFYGPSELGVFQQVFVLYMILSQLATGGIHLSVLRYVPQYVERRDICNCLVSSAIATTALLAITICAVAYVARPLVGSLFGSPDVSSSLTYALPGIPFFAVNKVLMAVVNANRRMRAYAVFQAVRYLLMGVLLAVAIANHLPGVKLSIILACSEVLLLFCLAPYSLRLFSPVAPTRWFGWTKKHIAFGLRSFLSGILTEANTRIDVLMLGIFASDRIVGIYSLAAIVAEGLLQLPVILQANLNPIIATKYFGRQIKELEGLIRHGIRFSYVVLGLVALLAAIAYPLFIRVLIGGREFTSSWPVFGILAAGIALSAGYSPFKMILIQTGHPGAHSAFIASIALTNVLMNGLLIPFFGMYGAAIATSLSFALSVIYIRILTRHYARMSI